MSKPKLDQTQASAVRAAPQLSSGQSQSVVEFLDRVLSKHFQLFEAEATGAPHIAIRDHVIEDSQADIRRMNAIRASSLALSLEQYNQYLYLQNC